MADAAELTDYMDERWFEIGAWGLAALAGLLALWALAWDAWRQRWLMRRRCPRCWYDLSGTAGALRCSECGFEARRERQLLKGRKRWRWAAVAGVLGTAAWGVKVTPGVRDRGWAAAVPTTVLLAGVPWVEDEWSEGFLELSERVEDQALSGWQTSWAIDRAVKGDRHRPPLSDGWWNAYASWLVLADERGWWEETERMEAIRSLVDVDLSTRERWPEGWMVGVEVQSSMWPAARCEWHFWPRSEWADAFDLESSSADWPRGVVRWIGPPPLDASSIEYEVEVVRKIETLSGEWNELRDRRVLRLPIQVGGGPAEVVSPMRSEPCAAILVEGLAPEVWTTDDEDGWVLRLSRDAIDEACRAIEPAALAVRLELLCDGSLAGETTAWWYTSGDLLFDPDGPTWRDLPLRPVSESLLKGMGGQGNWTLRLTADVRAAARTPRALYWNGEVEVEAIWPFFDEWKEN